MSVAKESKLTKRRGLSGVPVDLSKVRAYPTVIEPDAALVHVKDTKEPSAKEGGGVFASYVNAMFEERWAMNGDPVIFDEDGRLINGRLRMWACVKSGKPFATIVVYGVPRDARSTMGSHLQRTTRDMMGINGEVYAAEIAAGWPFVLGYMRSQQTGVFSVYRKQSLGVFETEGLTERYPAMRDSATFVREVGAVGKMGPGMITAAHYLMSMADRSKADAFIQQVADPSLDPDGTPAALAYKLADQANKRASQPWRLAIAIKAWNAYQAGAVIRPESLRYQDKKTEGRARESFPMIAGLPAGTVVDLADLPGTDAGRASAWDVFATSDRLRVSIRVFDPDFSADALTRNGPVGGSGNRNLRKTHVGSLARDLEDDAWVFNGQPIKFAASGRLIDGQHRLTACVKTGIPFVSLVVEGLDDEVFTTFDTGQRLGLATTLKEAGYEDSVTLAASVALLAKVQGRGWRTPTNHEGLSFIEEHPSLPASVVSVMSNGLAKRAPKSLLAALDYMTGNVDRFEADRFMEALSTGANIQAGTALLVLREYLNDPRRHTRPVTERLLRVSMNAWNGHRRNVVPYLIEEAGNFPDLV